MLDIKRRKDNPGRYAIRPRAQAARVALVDLLAEANKRTGYKIAPTEFYKGISGTYHRPSMDKTLDVVDRILAELELENNFKN